jgi:hypothetical protein
VSDISFFREFQGAFYKNKRKIATQQKFREKSINMKNILSESFPFTTTNFPEKNGINPSFLTVSCNFSPVLFKLSICCRQYLNLFIFIFFEFLKVLSFFLL